MTRYEHKTKQKMKAQSNNNLHAPYLDHTQTTSTRNIHENAMCHTTALRKQHDTIRPTASSPKPTAAWANTSVDTHRNFDASSPASSSRAALSARTALRAAALF